MFQPSKIKYVYQLYYESDTLDIDPIISQNLSPSAPYQVF